MTLYVGIDLHSNNNVVVIQDGNGACVKRKRLVNKMDTVLAFRVLPASLYELA